MNQSLDFIKIVKNATRDRLTIEEKLTSIKNLIQGYFRLEKGILNKTIYQSMNFDSNESKTITKTLEEFDYQIIKEILTKNTKKILRKFELKRTLDFNEKKDFLQVGMNTIFINGPFRGLWTTGKATFFLPISRNKSNNLKLEIFSLIPTTIIIGNDEKILKKILIKKFQTKKIDVLIDKINDEIIELYVDVEKRWLPNVVTKNSPEIPMGVNIKSITINKI